MRAAPGQPAADALVMWTNTVTALRRAQVIALVLLLCGTVLATRPVPRARTPLQLKGVILGIDNPVAMFEEDSGTGWHVAVDVEIGDKCWYRVKTIADDFVVLAFAPEEQPINDSSPRIRLKIGERIDPRECPKKE